jgi:transposase-like protein
VIGVRVESWSSDSLIECRDCGKWFDNRTGTLLCGVHADWRQLTLFVTLKSAKLKTGSIARLCQLSSDTIRRLSKRLIEDADA